MSKEFVVIETQEQFDQAISGRIGALQAKHSEATAALQKQIDDLTKEKAELNKVIEAGKSKDNEKEKLLEDLNKKVKGYEISVMKNRIALENGLSLESVKFLNGETEDDIKANAEALSSLINNKKIPSYDHEPDYHDGQNDEKQILNEWLKQARKE